jgi:hypothetical protein
MSSSNQQSAQAFTSFDLPQEQNLPSRGSNLDFLPAGNYEFNDDINTNSTSQNKSKPNDTVLDFSNFDNVNVTNTLRHRGPVGSYLEKYGVGWLLEQNTAQIESEDSLPLLEELDIDLNGIKHKIQCVVMPLAKNLNRTALRDDPDFWGPLFVVLLFAMLSVYGQFRVVSWIITIWILGSFLVFVIARVLGGEVTYSQIVGIIGYSLIPLLFMACISPFIKNLHYLNIMLKMIGLVWSTYSAATLLCSHELRHKKPLLLYPIFLLYIYFLSLYSGV